MDADVTVQEMMDRTFVGVSESDDLRGTVELMVEDGAGSVVVVRGQEPVGLLTQGDVLEHVVSGGIDGMTVADAMIETVPMIAPDATLPEAASELSARTTRRLVVTDGSEPVGVVTESDLVSASPFSRERIDDTEETPQMVTEDDVEAAGGGTSAGGRNFEDQAICEACGSFARDLTAINGQMLCADCRDI